MSKRREGSAWQLYPKDWPKCYWCGDPALDGHLTCGDSRCSEGAARDAVRFLVQECDSMGEDTIIGTALDDLQNRNGCKTEADTQ